MFPKLFFPIPTGTRSRQQHSRNLRSRKGDVFKGFYRGKAAHTPFVRDKKPRKTVHVTKEEKTNIHDDDNTSDVVVASSERVTTSISPRHFSESDLFLFSVIFLYGVVNYTFRKMKGFNRKFDFLLLVSFTVFVVLWSQVYVLDVANVYLNDVMIKRMHSQHITSN